MYLSKCLHDHHCTDRHIEYNCELLKRRGTAFCLEFCQERHGQ